MGMTATTAERTALNDRLKGFAAMPVGMKSTDGSSVDNLRGNGGTKLIDLSVPATGLGGAYIESSVTIHAGAMLSAATHMPTRDLTVGMACGFGGGTLEDLDNDTATGDGLLRGWNNASHTWGEIARLATAEGRSWDLVPIIWDQGSANGTDSYTTFKGKFEAVIGQYAGLCQQTFGMPPTWLWSVSGVFRNVAPSAPPVWHYSQVQMDLANQYGAQIIALNAYELHATDDGHLSATSELLAGELHIWLLAQKVKGIAVPNPIPTATRGTNQIVVSIPKRSDMTLQRQADKYAAGSIDQWGGWQVEGGGAITALASEDLGTTVNITLTTSGTITAVKYMAQVGDVRGVADRYEVRRGEFYLSAGVQSVAVPGRDLRYWLLPFYEVF